jgi:hypothetical protein
MILPSFTKILSSDPDISIFHDLVKKHGLIHNVKDVIFVPTNDAFKYLFPRVTDKEYELEEFLDMAITKNVMNAHVSQFRQPLHVKKGIQTSTGLIVKTNEVKFFVSWDPEDKWTYLAHRMDTMRFAVDGTKTFDQCHMTFRLFAAEKKEVDELYRLGVDSGKFHEATGLMMEQLSSMYEKSSEDFVENSIYKTIAESKELPSIKSWYRLGGRLSDPVLTNFVPRIDSNAEKVFMTFLTKDMCRGMWTLFTDHVSLEDSLSVVELVFRDEHAWTDIAIKFDIYYMVYGMIMDHLHEAPKTWIELGMAGASGKFVESITYMNHAFKNI